MTTPAPKKRRWRRWLWRLAIAAVVARLLLALFLPQVLAVAAHWWGLSLTMRSASLSITGLSLRLEDFAVGDPARPDAPPLLAAQELEADASLRDLLAGDLVLVDAALVGARVVLERGADGRLRLPAAFAAATQGSAEAAPAPAPAPAEATPMTFTLPARVLSARLHDLHVRIVDASGAKPVEYEVAVDADVSDLGGIDRPGRVLARLHAPEWFDTAWMRAEITAMGPRLRVAWLGELQGVHPARYPLPEDVRPFSSHVRTVGAVVRGSLEGDIDESGRRRTFRGGVRVGVEADGDERLHTQLSFGPTSEDGDTTTIPFAVESAVRDCVQSALVRDATCVIGGGEATVHARIAVERATLVPARELLRGVGIELPESGLGVQATLDATVGASLSASLHDVVVQGDGGAVRMPALQVRDVRVRDGELAIGAIVSSGPELEVARAVDGALRVAGVRFAPPPGGASAPATASSNDAPALPRVRLGSLDCTGVSIELRDERIAGAAPLRIDEIAVRGDGLTVGVQAPPGRLAASLRLVGGLDALRLDATVAPTASSLALRAQVTGSGFTAKCLAPWLEPLGIAPVLQDGHFLCTAAVDVATGAEGLAVDVQLADVLLRDGEQRLFAVASVRGSGVRLQAHEIDAGDWSVEQPFLAVHRGADEVRLLGLRIGLGAPRSAAPPAPGSKPRAAAPPAASTTAVALRHGDIGVRGAVVNVADDRGPPFDVGVEATVRGAGQPAEVPFEARLQIAGACERAELRGTYSLAARHAEAHIDVAGLRADGLQRLLPANVRCTLADGAASARLRSSLTAGEGFGARLELDELRLLDRGEELAALDHVGLHVETAPPDHVRIVTLDARGLRTEVATTPDGLQVPGFVLAPAPPPSTPPPATGPVRIPLLAVDALALVCERLVVRDRTAGDGEPVVIAGQVTMDPWQANVDAESSPPAKLHVRASALPLCADLQVDVEVDPYVLQPTVEATMRATGLDFTALQRISPRLGTVLQGTVSAAELSASLRARLDFKRRDARTIDFARPFGGEFMIDDVRFVDTATGKPLASVGLVEVVARAIDLRKGDVLLRSVEINDPSLEILRDADGLQAAGFRVAARPPGGAAAPPTAPASGSAHTPGSTPGSAPGGAAPAAARAEFAVDRLHVENPHLALRDATTTPPTLLPVAGGEVDLYRFSTRCLTEARPFAFDISLVGGDVPLDRRVVRSSIFAGMVGSAVSAVAGDTEHKTEQRPLFVEFSMSGHLQVVPHLRGSVQIQTVSFELPALRGIAKQSGVDIADGLVDNRIAVELRGPEGLQASGNQVFTWLSVSEPPGGPISTYLKLPAALETVMFLLRNEADEHRVPFDFTVPAAGIGQGGVRDKAAEALARVIGDAVGGATVRVASVFTGALGLTGGVYTPVTATVPFAAGDPLPEAHDLAEVIEEVEDDEMVELVLTHELGAGDLVRAAELATPPREEVAARADHLRQRRMAVGAARAQRAAAVDSLYGAGRMQEAHVKRAELVAQDELFDELERTLEQAVAMLANDSPRAARRRAQVAAMALGSARLAAVQAEVLKALPPEAAGRVVIRAARAATSTGLPAGGRVIACTRRRVVR